MNAWSTYCTYDVYGNKLRYRNMPNDLSPEDARLAITRTKQIMQEFNANPKIAQFMDEAKEVHKKILKANFKKYSDVDMNDDKPEE